MKDNKVTPSIDSAAVDEAMPTAWIERCFGEVLRKLDVATVMFDCEARITFCNDYLLELTGWRIEEVMGRNVFRVLLRFERGDSESRLATLLNATGDKWLQENEIFTRVGERRLMRWNSLKLRSETGQVIGMASVGEDITERRQAEARIAYLNRVYAVLSGINTLIVRVRDRDELFREACRIATTQGEFPLAMMGVVDRSARKIVTVALEGKDPWVVTAIKAVLSVSDGSVNAMVEEAVRTKLPAIANDSQNDPRVAFRAKHAELGCGSMVVLPLIVADEVACVLALYAREKHFFHEEEMKLLTELAGDIGFAVDHIETQERFDYLAYYDALTGLANRNLFLDRLAQHMRSAVTSGQQLGLFLIDLERFKNINDTLGQPAGDELLRQVADWLKQTVGDADLLTRFSADHFAVVLPNVRHEDEVGRQVERTLDAFINHPFRLNDQEFRIAAKIGIALFPHDGTDAATLFKHAEVALKKAKVGGDRYLFYAQRMTETVAGRLTLENQLRQALDREQFVLHYQPKVNIATGRLAGAEALIRWNDPATGLVPPARFIPILEETGLIYEVGRWAVHKAIADYLRWIRAGLAAVRIAVNVSPQQLRHRDFVADIKLAIGVDPVAADGLELEITESMVMQDFKHNIVSLHSIRALGVCIAIDDFGTGFSSLSYLAKLPVDTLKIDRSFITDMEAGQEGSALVTTIISLAHALKLNVVAEGVETRDQLRLLKSLSCDEYQGYLFGKPVPAEIFEAKYLASSATNEGTATVRA
ncbi:MAG TPA: EAL domain-containing protein [Steroidobacteraceae bacterium]|nr:EAL domain-containing protein [Steroidobacteraceae bacterium]